MTRTVKTLGVCLIAVLAAGVFLMTAAAFSVLAIQPVPKESQWIQTPKR